ncbi:MAG: helix-turn-helix domain-containing protein [Sporolactobacillus sp.]
MSHYHYPHPFERESILKNVALGQSIRAIAALLKRSPGSLSREWACNAPQKERYCLSERKKTTKLDAKPVTVSHLC